MGFLKLLYYIVVVTLGAFFILNHAPNLLEFEPQIFNLKFLKFDGALSVNKDLDNGKIILKDEVIGPECLEYKNGEIYTSLADGRIVTIKDDKVHRTVADTSEGSKYLSRPLGMRFYKDDLYVADAERGLLKVDVKTGKVTSLVTKSDKIHGKFVNFPDDLDIDNGAVYFSDMSTKWNLNNLSYGIIEHENSGRIYKHDLTTGKTDLLLDSLYYPNGVQLTHDKKALLIAETAKNRILRHHLSGSRKGQTEIFAELPGEPDNIRPSSRGGYWAPLFSGRDVASPHLSDRLASYPKIRKAMARLSHLLATTLDWSNSYLNNPTVAAIASDLKNGKHFFALLNVNHPLVIELDAEGNIVRSLHSSNPAYSALSHGLEHEGHLYLGSFTHPYAVKLKL